MTRRIRATWQAPSIRFGVLTAFVLLPAALSWAQPGSRQSGSEESQYDQLNLGFENAPDEQVEPLLKDLGSPDFETREAASKKIEAIGPAAFTALSRHYYSNRDYEVRLRIQDIVKKQYLWHTLLKRKGFMGVQYQAYTGRPIASDETAIIISRVEPGHAAQAAGLRPRDLIVSVDDKPINDVIEDFAEYIQDQGAGGKLVLGIIRRDQSQQTIRRIEVTLTLQARPIEHYNSPELLDEINASVQAYSIWWDKHFSLPRIEHDRMPTAEVLQIPD